MTVGKATLLTAGLVGVFTLGVVTSPTIRDHWTHNAPHSQAAAPATDTSAPAPAKAERRTTSARSTSAPAHAVTPPKEDNSTITVVAVSAWEPEFRNRVKAVLYPGARPEIAAADFDGAEQFMTVAHAARNTQVPFMVLKDRVVNQRQSLADAIHEFKPELDAKAEVTRARTEARSDLDVAG
jgi:hypothetical protein